MIKHIVIGSVLATTIATFTVTETTHDIALRSSAVNVNKIHTPSVSKDTLDTLKQLNAELQAKKNAAKSTTKGTSNASGIPLMSMIKEKTVYLSTPMTFVGNDIGVWDMITDTLYNITEDRETQYNIIFNVQGFGGDAYTLNKVANMLMFVSARNVKVYMRVVGPSYSAHAFLTCTTPNVIITPTGSLMYHAVAEYKSLFGLATYRNIDIQEPQLESMASQIYDLCVLNNRLTPAAVDLIKNGKEVIQMPKGDKIVTYETKDRYGLATAIPEAAKNLGVIITMLAVYLLIVYTVIRVGRKAWKD